MRLFGQILVSVAAFLAGCSTERYQGGFETSDLSARVLAPSGAPAVGARVWLVRSQGNSAPGTALDSGWTDSAGLVKFTVPNSVDRSVLGLDGKLDAWLAISPKPLLHSDSARLSLATTESVSIGAESNGEQPRLFVPGSHFLSTTNSTGRSVLALPRGVWTIAKHLSTGTSLLSSVQVDSLPVALDTLTPAPTDTPPAYRARDSLRLDGRTDYLDSTFPLPITWARDTNRLDSCVLMPSLVSDDTGVFVLETKPTWIFNGTDSQNVQGGAEIATGALPDSGTLAIQFLNPQAFQYDTILLRTMRLTDSAGSGSMVKMGFPGGIGPLDSVLWNQGPRTSMQTNSPWSSPYPMLATTWYFSWTPSKITVRADSALIGSVSTTATFRRLRFRLAATTAFPGRWSLIQLAGVRFYKPK